MSQHNIPLPNGRKINWPTAVTLVFLHIGAVAAFFFFSWKALAVALVLHWMAVGWGISLGISPLAHAPVYQCPKWLEYFFAICGTMTLEGGPMFWVGTHRIHHAKSDQPGDPHSPRLGGAFWSHLGWIMFGETNHNNTQLMAKYCPDLAKQPFYRWLNSWHWLPSTITGILLFAFGRLADVFVGILFPHHLRACTSPG